MKVSIYISIKVTQKLHNYFQWNNAIFGNHNNEQINCINLKDDESLEEICKL